MSDPGSQGPSLVEVVTAKASATGSALFDTIVSRLFAVTAAPDNVADISISEEMRLSQEGFLRGKGLMSYDERLVAFYNNALVSPAGEDKTNTCLFLTEERMAQVKESTIDVEVRLDQLSRVEVEHNSIFKSDYVVLFDKAVFPASVKMEVVRESVGNAFKRLLDQMISPQGQLLLLELKGEPDP